MARILFYENINDAGFPEYHSCNASNAMSDLEIIQRIKKEVSKLNKTINLCIYIYNMDDSLPWMPMGDLKRYFYVVNGQWQNDDKKTEEMLVLEEQQKIENEKQRKIECDRLKEEYKRQQDLKHHNEIKANKSQETDWVGEIITILILIIICGIIGSFLR